MRSVSRFEFHLLRILRVMLRRAPVEQVANQLVAPLPRPPCLSRDCVTLVQDQLSKGCVTLLARGGWHRDRYLRHGQAVTGRLWERTPPAELGLEFSRHTLNFLIWLTASDPRQRKLQAEANVELTVGDQLVLFLAYDAFRATEAGPAYVKQPVFNRHPLIRLAYPEDFAEAGLPSLVQGIGGLHSPAEQMSVWVTGQGGCLLEALEPWLIGRWKALERSKGKITRWQQMRSVGQAQSEVLDAYLGTLERLGRRDLGGWLLHVLSELVAGEASPDPWIHSLVVSELRAADRMETYRAAFALLHLAERFENWTAAARGVSFYDREDYAAGQIWLSAWERWNGEHACRQARAIIRNMDPLRIGGL